MQISVFGLGYVGTVTAACLAAAGNHVVAVDPDRSRVDAVRAGRSPVHEPRTDELVAAAVSAGRLRATVVPDEGVDGCRMALVAVGTPSGEDGRLDLSALRSVSRDIGSALARHPRPEPFAVVLRSTLLPGTTRDTVIPLLEETSGVRIGDGLEVFVNPEFLREGRAVADFHDPQRVVLGRAAAVAMPEVGKVLCPDSAAVFETDLETAEMTKYVDNTWHAVKVVFANEVGSIAARHGVDVETLTEIFLSDARLNISEAYLRPGLAFGGSCLPKDVRALAARASERGLDTPLIGAVLPSNEAHLDRAYELVVERRPSRVGVLGVGFKAGTDDLRESPPLRLIRRLEADGIEVRAFDPDLGPEDGGDGDPEAGTERREPLRRLVVRSLDELLAGSDTIVVANRNPIFRELPARLDGQQVIDLVGLLDRELVDDYRGFCS